MESQLSNDRGWKPPSFHVIFILFLCFIFLSSYILNYLRDGELRCSDDKAIRKDLLAETKFSQIPEIANNLHLNLPR